MKRFKVASPDLTTSPLVGGKVKTYAQRAAEMLRMRLRGMTYEEIGQVQVAEDGTPRPLTRARVHQILQNELAKWALEATEEMRKLDALRLDEMLNAIYPRVLEGDDSAISKALDILRRRAAMFGLDIVARNKQGFAGKTIDGEAMPEDDPQVIRVSIVGNPEHTRQIAKAAEDAALRRRADDHE